MRNRILLSSLFTLVLLSSLFLNLQLATSNKQIHDKWRSLFRETVNAGDHLATIVGVDRLGTRFATDVRNNKSGTLILTMSVACPACLASIDSWKRLTERAATNRIPVLIVSKDWYPDLVASSEAAGLSGTLVGDPTSATFTSLHMMLVPQTIFVNRSGAVDRAWIGAISATRETEIAEYLATLTKADPGL